MAVTAAFRCSKHTKPSIEKKLMLLLILCLHYRESSLCSPSTHNYYKDETDDNVRIFIGMYTCEYACMFMHTLYLCVHLVCIFP